MVRLPIFSSRLEHSNEYEASLTHIRLQQETFRGFESGTYNLLVATKSIEDLDIPKAYVVIRRVSRCLMFLHSDLPLSPQI